MIIGHAMPVYNSCATPNLDKLSAFEIAIGRKAVLAPRFEYKPKIPITSTHAKAQQKLQEMFLYFRKRLEEFRSNRIAIINKDRQHYGFTYCWTNSIHVLTLVEVNCKLAAENSMSFCWTTGNLQMCKFQTIFTYVSGWHTLPHGS